MPGALMLFIIVVLGVIAAIWILPPTGKLALASQ